MAITATTPRHAAEALREVAERRPAQLGALGAAAVAFAACMIVAIDLIGPLAVLIPPLGAIGVHLLNRPERTLMVLAFAMYGFEDSEGLLGFTSAFFDTVPGPTDVLLVLLVAGLVIELVRRDAVPAVTGWVLAPLPFLALGVVSGVLTGYFGGADLINLLNTARTVIMLATVPVLVAVAVDSLGLVDRLLRFVVIVVSAKAAFGVVAWLAGQGRQVGSQRLTYYSPTMNQMALIVVLAVIAWRLRGGVRSVPPVMVLAAFAATGSLLFSFRRSFWIAFLLAGMITIVVATGRRGRVWIALVGGASLLALALTLSAGGATNTDNPIVQRAQIRNDAEDRYRLEEQKNVFAEIQRQPLTGIGFGVPWEARHPLSIEFGAGRDYTHVIVFWFWLKAGPWGVVGYAAVVVATVAMGFELFRRTGGAVGAAGLGIATAELGRAVAELTGSFTGVTDRFTVGQMIVMGWLAAALLAARNRDAAAATPLELTVA